jgi:hypothetical protein
MNYTVWQRTAFRWLVVACQLVSFWITWPLWEARSDFPMLPALPLPQFDLGLPLVASLLVVLYRPLIGCVAHSVVLLYALLADQVRLQPEFVSLALLLWGTLPNPGAQLVARAHLVALWLFAGLNKLLSPAFLDGTAQWIVQGVVAQPPAWLLTSSGYLIALGELALGLLAVFPRTRRLVGVGALALHAGILFTLSPLGHNWNQAVWPWNVALAGAGFALIVPWRDTLWLGLRRSPLALRLLCALILLSPLGFYVGLTDAYLAHNLYSANTSTASGARVSPDATWYLFNVPFPPEHRLYRQLFAQTCQTGDTLLVYDQRWWYEARGLASQRLPCPTP